MPVPDYKGMTVNERLYAAGLLEAFDAAVVRGDKDELIRLLVSTNLSHADACATAFATLADPVRYGSQKRR